MLQFLVNYFFLGEEVQVTARGIPSVSAGSPVDGGHDARKSLPKPHLARLLEGAPGFADTVMEFGPLLRFVLGFMQVADGAEVVLPAFSAIPRQSATSKSASNVNSSKPVRSPSA